MPNEAGKSTLMDRPGNLSKSTSIRSKEIWKNGSFNPKINRLLLYNIIMPYLEIPPKRNHGIGMIGMCSRVNPDSDVYKLTIDM